MFDRQTTTVHRPFAKGERVRWRGRAATVNAVKLMPPEFVRVMAYILKLDDQEGLRLVPAPELMPEPGTIAAMRQA